MLHAHDLECQRGDRLLFGGLSFTAEAGSCLHIAGENGAGKTSLLRILCGLLAPTAGEVRYLGNNIAKLQEEYWQDLAYVGHLNGVKDDLTAAENLHFAAAIAGRSTAYDAAAVQEALAALGLSGFEHSLTRFLSQGQRRRVALARLFFSRTAPVWILDEPYTALDTRGVTALSGLIDAHLQRGGTVILTTHQEVPLPGRVERLVLQAAEPA